VPQQLEHMSKTEARSERWVLRVGRGSRGRGGMISIGVMAFLSGLMLVVAVVQRHAPSLMLSALFMLMGLLSFERRVFDRIVRRQAEEIARLEDGGGD
jgi:hypothetical protein